MWMLGLAVWMGAAHAADPDVGHIRMCADSMGAPAAVVEAAKKRTVRIETTLGSGSGFFISPDGYLYTAAHVVGSAENVDVVLLDGSTLPGKVVRVNPGADVALVKVTAPVNTPCLPVAKDRGLAGSDVYVIGSPAGAALTHSVSKGVVSGYREVDGIQILQTDASINPGNSGGVVLAPSGAALGVVSFKAVGNGFEGLGFAIAVESISTALHLEFAAASDAEVSHWVDKSNGGPAASGGSIVAPTITARPDPVVPMTVPKHCTMLQSTTDAFTSAHQVTWYSDGVSLRWATGGPPSISFPIYGPALSAGGFAKYYGAPLDPSNAMNVEVKLADGTLISFKSETAMWGTNGWGTYWIKLDGPVNADVMRAMGSSPAVGIRAVIESSTPISEPIDPKNSAKWTAAFACAVSVIEP